MRAGLGFRLVLRKRDEHLLVRSVPGRNLMPPPQLARYAPWLDVLHPAEEFVAASLGHELHATVARRRDRPLRQLLGVGIPLLGEVWFDRHAAAIAIGHGMGVRLDLLDQAEFFHFRHDLLAGVETVEAAVFLRRVVVYARELVEDVDGLQIVPATDLEIVEIVRWRDLHRAGALFGVGVFVGDDPDPATDQRQHGMLADQVFPLGVVGVHRNAGIAQHRLGPRGRHHDELIGGALDRVFEIPQAALHLARLDF